MSGIGPGTRDIDIVALETAAAVVARDLALERNWLNAGPSGLLVGGLPAGFAERVIRRDYGSGLRVSFASRIDQIFFKLYAAADRREPRDFADLHRLDPTVAELRDAARWARTHNMPAPFDDAIA